MRRVVLLIMAVVAMSGCASSTSARGPEQTSISTADAQCPLPPCNDPSELARQASDYPPARPIDPKVPWLSEADVTAKARNLAIASDGSVLTDDARDKLATKASQMTAEQAAALVTGGQAFDSLLPPDRPLWVVTVQGHVEVDGSPSTPSRIVDVYTAVYDAPSGFLILLAKGIGALPTG